VNWKSDVFLVESVGLAFRWIWRISLVATILTLLWAIIGNPQWHYFIVALLATMVSELLYQVHLFKLDHAVLGSEYQEPSGDMVSGPHKGSNP